MSSLQTDLQQDKKAMRATVLAARDGLPETARRAASRAIVGRLLDLPEYREARCVMTYMSFGVEVDTHGFFEALLADAKTILLPRIDRIQKRLRLHAVARREDLVPGVWGILEPRDNLPVVSVDEADFMLVPGLAFDRAGRRLGYGAGYYDRLLSGVGGKPWRIAAAFDCQIVDAVPAGAMDQPIHALISPTQLLRFPT
jgi:5-formyltetrahydrofolate cyclo-ligase